MTFNYREYLASREWAVRKKAVRERSGGLCERCLMDVMSVVHHLTYEHIGNEPLEDLQGLCRGCHTYLSAEIDVDPALRIMWLNGFVRLARLGVDGEAVQRAIRRTAELINSTGNLNEIEQHISIFNELLRENLARPDGNEGESPS